MLKEIKGLLMNKGSYWVRLAKVGRQRGDSSLLRLDSEKERVQVRIGTFLFSAWWGPAIVASLHRRTEQLSSHPKDPSKQMKKTDDH